MKKLGVIILTGCVLAALAAGPAQAAPAPSTAEAQELCRSVFAVDRCENLADEWASVVSSQDAAAIRDFARLLVADAGLAAVGPDLATVCEAIFSDNVCAAIREAGATVRDIVDNPPTLDEIRYIILWLADCVVHQTCIAPAPDAQRSSTDDPCREVFSDGVCDRVEDPVGTVQWLYDTVLRCYLDPACTPTPNIYCNQFYCIR